MIVTRAGRAGGVLAGKRVAITGGEIMAEHLARAVHDLGADQVLVTAIAREAVTGPDAAPLRAALGRLGSYDWIVFTSTAAVQIVRDTLLEVRSGDAAGSGRSQTWLTGGTGRPRVAAVGSATAAALVRTLAQEVATPEQALASAIPDALGDVRGCRILLPRGDLADSTLPDALSDRGAVVDEVLAYRTVAGAGCGALAELVRHGGVDAVTFASSSGVRYFMGAARAVPGSLETLSKPHGERAAIACIGPRTAATARELGLPVDAVAATHDAGGLARAVLAALRVSRTQHSPR